ncbi:MAG: hypothetical protein AUJ34_02795 [Parcubacteria group bacterium CG1_02_41_12]|nr:MAG: hypothetical protein AUJ34_02795 [Parcubacteria group bacterium CG1_02_41_12]PIP66977.1 MAG: ribose-5-phosphate isomerase [Parcubacteria group bacterium CG22_combo_CG10-13_8_21_14_all_41_9]PIQ79634.1 MAG: ribose-5-phosphate isomerase [Parcubacteria group bacterium CG11_big_fil_rev_8_21_14_0_20_41_14]PIR56903.1 MAG: ribose-5-phosphate isomerase [Parcubacteria group bacterium CG10_big_fil_rev_8_21_14_0_10_41_35]PIZ78114.1 MAG: ribose-5-phosphate isomerase [Parcubacteria group bacterium CG
MIYLGADHNGFKLKEKIKIYFEKHSISYADLGADELDKDDDYPDFALLVAKKVGLEKGARGILICGSGNGMAIAANKIKGVRAAVVIRPASAARAVEEDGANIMALGSSAVSRFRVIALVKVFLSAQPSKAERHIRRIKKISELEK